MHRIFCQEIPGEESVFSPDAREAEHLFKVFRARPGDKVGILDGKGGRAYGEVADKRTIRVETVETVPEPEEKLHLCCALPRRQKLDSLLKQATELGAWTIRPVNCERSVAEGNPRERWELLLQEACKQSGNAFLPEIRKEQKLNALLEELQQENIDIYYGSVKPLPPGEKKPELKREKAVLIGPEGGFTGGELEAIEAAGGKPLNLGPHILRLETAALAALAVLRFLSLACCIGVIWMLCGCEAADVNRNPLMIKAEQLREEGRFDDARRFLRQAVARYPESPEVYLALGKLCEENLNEPLEAIYCYRNFLQFVPESDPRRAAVEKFVAELERQLAEKAVKDSPELARLRQTVKNLNDELNLAKQIALYNQEVAEKLKEQLKALQKRRSGRGRGR